MQNDREEQYRRIETVYLNLRDNFKKQDNLSSADDVMYELAWQKQEILNGVWWRIYGWVFGWGYQPWKFLLFIVLPVLLFFSGLWYWKYYKTIYEIIYQDKPNFNPDEDVLQKNWLEKLSHTLFFSGSVLLSIRLKKDWLIEDKTFLSFLYLEWVVGIVLYIIFAIFVQGSRFQFVKGLLGF